MAALAQFVSQYEAGTRAQFVSQYLQSGTVSVGVATETNTASTVTPIGGSVPVVVTIGAASESNMAYSVAVVGGAVAVVGKINGVPISAIA